MMMQAKIKHLPKIDVCPKIYVRFTIWTPKRTKMDLKSNRTMYQVTEEMYFLKNGRKLDQKWPSFSQDLCILD